jgi:ribosomal protein L31E
MNSNLANWYFSRSFPSNNHIASNQLAQIPIRTINFSDPTEKTRHSKIVSLVEQMLALHSQKEDVKTDHEKNLIERQIEATDRQINALVYELYELTEEEIQIVERTVK